MARITKDPVVRRNEIIDAAEKLFYSVGYDETSVSDIVKAIGVAQGTFYNYFTSKDAVLEALVQRHVSKIYIKLEGIEKSEMTAVQKFEKMFYTIFENLRNGDGWVFDFLYYNKHLQITEKIIRQGGNMFLPFTKKIIEEGNRKGEFSADYIDETLEFITAVLQCFTHALYQRKTDEELRQQLVIVSKMIGGAIGIKDYELRLLI
ncbi:MAG: TetR/AcrR family transcriptional regulator [Acholeplasmataceae bacterium]|jgi:Transcriptional regulator|nr:TetR/AcrR family transcriptional regulator [Acholeplasmataceae bacterium]